MDKRDKWYPKEVYNRDENITRRNKEEYDRREDAAWKVIYQIQKDIGRDLTIPEGLRILHLYHRGNMEV